MPTPELKVRRWKGIRLYYPKSEKATDELSQATNVMFDREGVLVSRPGFNHMEELTPAAPSSSTVVGMGSPVCMWNNHATSTVHMMFTKSDRLWYSDGVNDWIDASFTAVPGYEGVMYGEKCYFASGVFWNGNLVNPHSGMPTGKEVISVHKDRLWITTRNNTLAGTDPQRIYFSEPGVPDSGSWPAANFIDVRTGTPNRGLVSYRDSIYIFKPESVWVLNTGGLPANWTLRQLGDKGSIGGYCVYNNSLYWLGGDGLFSYNGVEINKLSDAIQKHFDDILIDYDDTCQVVGYDGNLYIQYKQLGGPRIFWIYNIARKAFTVVTPPFGSQTGRMIAIHQRAGTVTDNWKPGVYFGSGQDAAVNAVHRPNLWKFDEEYHTDTNHLDVIQDYDIIVETAQIDFDEPHDKKRVQLCTLEGQFENLTVEQIDEEDRSKVVSWSGLNTFYTQLQRFPGIGYCRSVRFKITGPSGNAGVKIYALRAELKPRGRESANQAGTYALQP